MYNNGCQVENNTSDKTRALDKREYLVIIRDSFCKFCIKTYVVTPHLNRPNEAVQMRGHNIKYSLLSRALKTRDSSFVVQYFHVFLKASEKSCAYVNILLQFSFGHHVIRYITYSS